MRKFLAVLVMVVVFMVGCGSKAEPVTLGEVTGYWLDEDNGIFEILESGSVVVHMAVTNNDGNSAGRWAMPMGSIVFGDEIVITFTTGEMKCEFSEDRNAMTMKNEVEEWKFKRITIEEAKAMGVTK